MAINLNADVGEIIKGLLARNKQDGSEAATTGLGEAAGRERAPGCHSPFIKPLAAIGAVALGVTCYIGAYYAPQQAEISKKNETLAKTLEMQAQIPTLEGQIASLKKKLSGSREHYQETLARFGDSDNLEDLYHAVSTLALMHDIAVLNVKGLDSKPRTKDSLVQETRVDVEMRGRFGGLMRFKEELMEDRSLLTINAESLELATDQADPGVITVKMQLTAYTIDKKPFHEAMLNSERMVASYEK